MVRLACVTALAVGAIAAGSALGASGADTFRTPSGNIYCAYEHYSFAPVDLRCEIRSGIKPAPTCSAAALTMRPTGRARTICITDTIYNPNARVLGYGTTFRGGGFTCTSRTTGLRCTNRSGHGVFLSRERSYAF